MKYMILILTLFTFVFILVTTIVYYRQQDNTLSIPKIIFLTTHLPLKHVPNLLQNKVEAYNVYVYNDISARKFLVQHWSNNIVQTFDRLKKGAHKIDLWRYCILYTYGGVYLDIKTIPLVNLHTLFHAHNTWYTSVSFVNGFYQGIIATPKANQILLQCIQQIVTTSNSDLENNYLLITQQMQQICNNVYSNSRTLLHTAGTYTTSKAGFIRHLVLFKEKHLQDLAEPSDRYGKRNYVFDKHGTRIFKTRHTAYPWRYLPEQHESIFMLPNLHVI
jgi:hypothetical protein